ncbi:MAG: PIN domain-containing protein [Acidobacteria bacterium]|nr:PIN domain-containing protein [Acidobacteriota bacterium]
MILVDTSVWIETFRARTPLRLQSVVDFDEVVTCLPVIQEVLQGFRDERAFRAAREAMLALPAVESPLGIGVVEDAVELYRAARRQGMTVRSSVDCLIAACAVRNGLTVLHRDRDYPLLAKVSGLQQRPL